MSHGVAVPLVLQTRKAKLSRLMPHLYGAYTHCFNRSHGLSGHLFQGRFKAILVGRDAYLTTLVPLRRTQPCGRWFGAQPS